MHTDEWSDCIITAFDLVGTTSLAGNGQASSIMVQMHSRAAAKINNGLPLHSHGYIWNDSVLLLSYTTEPNWTKQGFLAELNDFKEFLDRECQARSYAISVKGKSFPRDSIMSPVFNGQIADQPRAVLLRTSSWAMANCFIIEKALKQHRADWYIDSRIAKDATIKAPFEKQKVELLPKNDTRTIYMFKGSLV